MDHRDLTETFKFEYEDDCEDEIWRKGFFRVFSKNFILLLFFNRKVNTVIFIEGGSVLSRSQMTTRHDLNDLITCFRYYDVFVQTRSRMTTRGSFLDRPGNFSSSKTNFKIKTCWIEARFLAQKLVNFASLTYSFVVLFSNLLKLWSWMQTQTQNSFPGPKSYRDFWEPGPRTAILFSRHNDTGSRTVLTIREVKIHVYGKRQTSDSSWEFLRMKNKQIKTVQNNFYGENWLETTYFWVEVINSKRQLRENLVTWYKFTFAVWRQRES